jgi:hypothetical protein
MVPTWCPGTVWRRASSRCNWTPSSSYQPSKC